MAEEVPYRDPKERAEDARIAHRQQIDREFDEKFNAKQIKKARHVEIKEKIKKIQTARTDATILEVVRNGAMIFVFYIIWDAWIRCILFHYL